MTDNSIGIWGVHPDNDPDPQPVAWALYNPATGKIDHRCYQREESARAGAENQSNRWRTFVAVPLFLHPGTYTMKVEQRPGENSMCGGWPEP